MVLRSKQNKTCGSMSENANQRRSQRLKEKAAMKQRETSQVMSCPGLLKSHSSINKGSESKSAPKTTVEETSKCVSEVLMAGVSVPKESRTKSKKSKNSVSRRYQAELECTLMKKKLEQEELQKKQEMLDLELALKLSRLEDEELSSEDSEESEFIESVSRPDIKNWIKGEHPWQNEPNKSTASSSKTKEKVNEFSYAPENNCALPDTQFSKFLARQSMPKELPIFSGNPLEWPNFIFQYRNSTKVCGYSQEENHCRLQKCLKGNALKIVQSLLIMPQNVNTIMSILESRFGQPQQIIFMLLEKVKNFPIVKEDRLDLLIHFSDEVKNLVGTIESLNQVDHLQNPILLQELTNKLPNSYKMMWVEFITSKTTYSSKIIEFSLWLDKKSMTACQIEMPKWSEMSHEKVQPTGRYSNKKNATLTTTDKKACICCKKDLHYLSSCTTFKSFSIDERWNFVTKNRICFSCLIPFHSVNTCRKKIACGINDCRKRHHRLLHTESNKKDTEITSVPNEKDNDLDVNCHISNNKHVLLKILPVIISYNTKIIKTYALLDDASTVTLIDEDLANDLDLQGPKQSLCIQWTNNQIKEQDDSRIVSFTIKSEDCAREFQVRHVRTMKGLALRSQSVDSGEISERYPYVSNKVMSMTNAKPRLLIGQDNWPLLVSRKIIKGPWNGPALSETLLGWVIHGNISTNPENHHSESLNFVCYVNEEKQKDDLDILHELVKSQWKMDACGTEQNNYSMSKEDKRAQDILDRTMRRIGDRWETGLLWRDQEVVLPDSKETAFKRLVCTERKMDKNAVYGRTYCDKINDLLHKGYIRKLSEGEAGLTSPKTWYLPHFGIENPNKPNKLRVVFDASSKSNGVSLNDCLMTGPDLYNSLHIILLNFRIKKFAFIGDIKEMFLQVRVRKEDCVAQRFLWREMDRFGEPSTYEIGVVFFGSSNGPCLAQEAKNRNAREFADTFPEAAKAIIEQHYMDDYLGNADTIEEGKRLIKDVIYIHEKGGFTMCNWVANSSEILEDVNPDLRTHGSKEFESTSENYTERILGVFWNPCDDTFTFQTKFHKIDKDILENKRRPTKREILKLVMTVFDPLGFLTNLIIQSKIILQDIWKLKLGWDDEITDSLNEKWKLWLSDMRNIFSLKIPRVYFTLDRNKSEIHLHIFCDASERSYATVAYLRSQLNDEVQVTFVNAKARVTPLKQPVSIPRLELQAALLGARLGHYLISNLDLKIKEVIYWTDSKTVLHWIKSEVHRYKVFVAHRLTEIHSLTEVKQWRYINSRNNVADEATKRYHKLDFSSNSRWLHGPEFLQLPEENWPQEKATSCQDVDINIFEEKKEYTFFTVNSRIIPIPSPAHFSKWKKLVRSTGSMLRFIERVKGGIYHNKFSVLPQDMKKKNLKNLFLNLEELDTTEMANAEKVLFKKVQSDAFPEKIRCLENNITLKKESRLYSLSCIMDKDGLLRLQGRFDNMEGVSEDFKNPIILDPKHQITKLLIHYYHEKVHHHGQEIVINNLREKFWILRLRQAVKGVWSKCQKCRNRKTTPNVPIMGQLPLCRLEPTIRPFIKTGVDYFGPIMMTVKRSHEKRYGVIFTCMVTRAVHLEIAHDLTTDGFIHVLRQFGCRRGFPKELYSDNGTNFKSAQRELHECLEKLNQTEIKKFCTLENIAWKFIPPSSPNMGGAWERLIQIVKKILKEVLHEKYPQEYVLRTMLTEAENIINSRPLTHISVDSDDSEPLTPNHFLIGPSYAAMPCTDVELEDIKLLCKWKAAQKLSDTFWKRWTHEYLPYLRKRSKWHQETPCIQQDDIVIIVDPNGPRNVWPKGRVVKLHPGKDKRIRIVDVKLANGNILRRPVSRLCVLPVKINEE